jgi:hypothetical protein
VSDSALPDPSDDVPYAEDEWSVLLDELYGHPVDTMTLRNLLEDALITLSVIAVGRPNSNRAGDVHIAARRLRATKRKLERGKEAAV